MQTAASSGKGDGKGKAPPPPAQGFAPRKSQEGAGYLAPERIEARRRESELAEAERQEVERAERERRRAEMLANLDAATPSERFSLDDVERWKTYLERYGYVVLADVVHEQEREEALNFLWAFMSTAPGEVPTPQPGWERDNPETWVDESLSAVSSKGAANGIINKCGAGQSDLNWYVRTLPRVRQVFESLWDTNRLLTSYDGFGVFRPWHNEEFRARWQNGGQTLGGWLHVDQAGAGYDCVQGLVSLFDQDHTTGGLTVIPGSHHMHEDVITQANPKEGEYIELSNDHAEHQRVLWMRRKLVHMEAGDFALWDSRCVHCSTPATAPPTSPQDRLLRAVVYVCMTPTEKADGETLKLKKELYINCATATHWPHKNFQAFHFKTKNDWETAAMERRALIEGFAPDA